MYICFEEWWVCYSGVDPIFIDWKLKLRQRELAMKFKLPLTIVVGQELERERPCGWKNKIHWALLH